MPLVPVKTKTVADLAHAAIDHLVEKLLEDGEQHSFQLDSLLKANAELRAEVSRLQSEIEAAFAAPPATAKKARKQKAPKPVEAAVLPDSDAP